MYRYLCAGVLAVACSSSLPAGLVVVDLVADETNSTSSEFGGSLAATLNDSFAYDPLNPTVNLPNQSYSTVTGNGFHARLSNGQAALLSYDLVSGPMTFTGDLNFDLYGRSNGNVDRDNDIDIQLFNGDYLTPVTEISGIGIPDDNPYHQRASFSLSGVTFDRVRIVGNNSTNRNTNFFTLMEFRMNADASAAVIPEPSSLACFATVMPLMLMRFRRRRDRCAGAI